LRGFNVAVVGATGMVGQEFLKILQEREFPVRYLALFASEKTAGKKVLVFDQELEVKEIGVRCFQGMDIAFFSAGTEVSRHYAPRAVQEGALVIDNSAAFRMEPQVPLVVPEVNPQDLEHHKGLIANPNCSTIQMVVALNPLHRVNPIKRILVDTYQSVSGTGREAVEELSQQTKDVLEGRNTIPHVYPHQIAFNLIPEIDVFLDNGYTKEEWKMVQETRKILHAPEMAISATCVRVPVYVGHSEAIHVEFSHPMEASEARQILMHAPGVRVLDDVDVNMYPHPWAVTGNNDVYVGRIREDASHPYGLVLWVVADNLRKGAALNAVQIAETMIKQGWLSPRGA
jgi:aspartate-semialdehyde dehydrogenase